MSDMERGNLYEDAEDIAVGGSSGKNGPKKRVKKTRGKKAESKLIVAFVALALMFITFVVLIVVEDRLINDEETRPVVVALAEVPQGFTLDQNTMPSYFTVEYRPVSEIPVGVTTYSSGAPMIGLVTDRVIRAKEIVTDDCFYEADFFDEVEDAVELSLDLGAIGQTVGGTLRPGDLIDIKAVIKIDKESLYGSLQGDEGLLGIDGSMDDLVNVGPVTPVEPIEGEVVEGEAVEELEEVAEEVFGDKISSKDAIQMTQDGSLLFAKDVDVSFGITGDYVSQVIAEDVRVVQVLNSGGETVDQVEAAGGTMVATVINVVVPRNMVDAILIAQAEGTVSLSRVEEKADEETAADVATSDSSVEVTAEENVEDTEVVAEEQPVVE